MTNIAKLRNRAGITQEHAADKLCVDRSTVAKWEAGASFPRAAMLPKIAALYGCTLDDLLIDNTKTPSDEQPA